MTTNIPLDPQAILDAFVKVLRDEAAAFIKANQADVSVLGESAVKAILSDEIKNHLPIIPNLAADAAIETIVVREELLRARSDVFQLIAKADREHAERVARVRGNAIAVAGKVAGSAASIVGAIALKVLLGG